MCKSEQGKQTHLHAASPCGDYPRWKAERIGAREAARRLGRATSAPRQLARAALNASVANARWKTVGAGSTRSGTRCSRRREELIGPVRGRATSCRSARREIIDTADMPTSLRPAVYHGHRPAADAAMRGAGARRRRGSSGKTVSTEFAWPTPGKTRSPHDPRACQGGSQAARRRGGRFHGAAPCARRRRSIVRHASYCGIVGYKPTARRCRAPDAARRSRHPGVRARSPGDAALLVGALSGRDALRNLTREALGRAPRIALCRTPNGPPRIPNPAGAEHGGNRGARRAQCGEPRAAEEFAGLLQAQIDLMYHESYKSLASGACIARGISDTLRIWLAPRGRWMPRATTRRARHRRFAARCWARCSRADVISTRAPGEAPGDCGDRRSDFLPHRTLRACGDESVQSGSERMRGRRAASADRRRRGARVWHGGMATTNCNKNGVRADSK